jgi:hypothetical protein
MAPTDGRVREPSHCSFCDKTADQVYALIGGSHGAFICNECVGECGRAILQHRLHDAMARAAVAHRDPD